MTQTDKRHHQRIDTLNLISYDCLDESGQVVLHGIGRTLNVSEGGILLETHEQFEPESTVLLTIALEDDLIEIEGKVISSKPSQEDKFEAGIKLLKIGETERTVLNLYIQAFKEL